MTTFAKQFNKGGQFDIDMESLDFVNLKELMEEPGNKEGYRFTAVWFNKNGAYGEQAVLVLHEDGKEKRMVSLPSHLAETVHEIVTEYHAEILNGQCGFTVYDYESKKRKNKCYSVRWVDLKGFEELPF